MYVASHGSRRHLPHIERPDATYFVTFATIARHVLPPASRTIALETCLAENGATSFLYAVVIMPDHVHLILQPYSQYRLPTVMQRIKGVSAHRINKAIRRRGALWTEESFDRIARRGQNIQQKGEYICQNPVRAGLVTSPDQYPWLWRAWVEGAQPRSP